MSEARKPLYAMKEAIRIARLEVLGLGPDLLPLNATEAERRAALGNQNEPHPVPAFPPAQLSHVIPPVLVKVATVLATLLALTAGIVASIPSAPVWLPFALSGLGAVAALLAGLPMPGLKVPAAPLVPVALVPALLSASGGLVTWATQLPPCWLQSTLLILAPLLAGLAGKAAPTVTTAAPK